MALRLVTGENPACDPRGPTGEIPNNASNSPANAFKNGLLTVVARENPTNLTGARKLETAGPVSGLNGKKFTDQTERIRRPLRGTGCEQHETRCKRGGREPLNITPTSGPTSSNTAGRPLDVFMAPSSPIKYCPPPAWWRAVGFFKALSAVAQATLWRWSRWRSGSEQATKNQYPAQCGAQMPRSLASIRGSNHQAVASS